MMDRLGKDTDGLKGIGVSAGAERAPARKTDGSGGKRKKFRKVSRRVRSPRPMFAAAEALGGARFGRSSQGGREEEYVPWGGQTNLRIYAGSGRTKVRVYAYE